MFTAFCVKEWCCVKDRGMTVVFRCSSCWLGAAGVFRDDEYHVLFFVIWLTKLGLLFVQSRSTTDSETPLLSSQVASSCLNDDERPNSQSRRGCECCCRIHIQWVPAWDACMLCPVVKSANRRWQPSGRSLSSLTRDKTSRKSSSWSVCLPILSFV